MNIFLKDLDFQLYIKNRYLQNIIIDNDKVIWNVEKDADNIDTILNMIMKNYESSLNSCKEVIDKYLNYDIDEISDKVKEIIDRFKRSLKYVHPYFATEVTSRYKNILPYQYIFIEQILDTLASKYIIYTDSSKIEEDVNRLFKNYVQPIIEVINDENYCIDRIKEEF